jgi:hypothetical protein
VDIAAGVVHCGDNKMGRINDMQISIMILDE